jgi:hypothetical protein
MAVSCGSLSGRRGEHGPAVKMPLTAAARQEAGEDAGA